MKITLTNKWVSIILIALLPFYIVFLAEINSTQSLNDTLTFILRRPTVIIFNLLFISLLLFSLTILFKKLYISIIIVGGLLYILSLVEYFKHSVSSSHFLITDITMVGNAADIARFANISIHIWMVVNLITLVSYAVACARLKIRIESKPLSLRISGILIMVAAFWIILSPRISGYLYRAFDVDTRPSTNSFAANEKYANNSFLANLLQSSAESIASIVSEPDNYNANAINSLTEKFAPSDQGKRPNIIFIACESFSDFRCFPSLEIDSDVYRGFDAVTNMETTATGYLFSPTFGGYTARAEFELITGLPVKSLQNATIPHYLIKDTKKTYSIARSLSDASYYTSYIHPFSKSFYNRDDFYPRYGFHELIFDTDFDDLGITPEYYGDYINDSTAYNAIKSILLRKDNAPNYIFTTTMQNHQPYISEDDTLEFEVYLNAIKTSSDALHDFVLWLEKFEEETILVFVGDHFPFFSSESLFYENLGLNASNCEILYKQQFIVYSNKERPDIDTSRIFSEFYLPGLVLKSAGAPLSKVNTAILSQFESNPLYSTNADDSTDSIPLFDLLTYDIVCGEAYALDDNSK
ncbi:MAG: sulfatase-like hydrolase/transferase [Clostridiales bacterium]|nr:sulfatase-like hydrolase/transferase [Clostridiales bacterium]